MKVATFEAVVENGQIRLPDSVRLPEKARVYVGDSGSAIGSYGSLRLARSELATDFEKEVIEGDLDAGLWLGLVLPSRATGESRVARS